MQKASYKHVRYKDNEKPKGVPLFDLLCNVATDPSVTQMYSAKTYRWDKQKSYSIGAIVIHRDI